MDMETSVETVDSQDSSPKPEQAPPATIRTVAPDALKALYDKAKELAIAGMGEKEIAARLNLSYHALRKKSYLEQWPTPVRLEAALKKTAKIPKTAEIMAASLLERGEKFRARLLDRAEASIEAAELKPLEDWRDAKLALDIVDTITGLNKPQASTNILISGVGSVSMDNESTAQSPFYRPLPDSAPENSEEPAPEGQVIDVEEQW